MCTKQHVWINGKRYTVHQLKNNDYVQLHEISSEKQIYSSVDVFICLPLALLRLSHMTWGGVEIYSGCTQSLFLLLQMSHGEILGITASVKPVWCPTDIDL